MYRRDNRLQSVLRLGAMHNKGSIANSVIDAANTRWPLCSTKQYTMPEKGEENEAMSTSTSQFGEFQVMFAPVMDGRHKMKEGLPFDDYTKPRDFPDHWIRIAGKNKTGMRKETTTSLVQAVDDMVKLLKREVLARTGISRFGVIWEGDNYEYNDDYTNTSPFSVVIARLMMEDNHCMAIKNKDRDVSKAFYDGWGDIRPEKTWMMFVDGTTITKEDEAMSRADIGTFFFGSAMAEHMFKPDGLYTHTQGYSQVVQLRKLKESYLELELDERPGMAVLFLKKDLLL